MLKHFKMYVTITDIIDKKRIDLTYPIKNFNKKVAVISIFSDNIQYELTEPWALEMEESRIKGVMAGTNTRQELIDFIEGKMEMT